MTARFTLDGSDALELHLAQTCEKVRVSTRQLVPDGKLECLLLGGGYGRGEGGVLKTNHGDEPYNDLEFYACLRGFSLLNERRFRPAFEELGHQLSSVAGLEVEFKVTSLARLRTVPPTMFFYDLCAGHRVIDGDASALVLHGQPDPAAIPLYEATRLLMNRCSGLLFADERLRRVPFTADDADFVGRNHAKAVLAFGDVILTAHRLYHWQCRERHRRLLELKADVPGLDEIKIRHAAAVEFKLHPQRKTSAADSFQPAQKQLVALALPLWLWLESRRLATNFASPRDYSFSKINKCPETRAARNRLIHTRCFGPASLLAEKSARYPRERLFHALGLLLWEPDALADRSLLGALQNELRTNATSFPEIVQAYRHLWQRFN